MTQLVLQPDPTAGVDSQIANGTLVNTNGGPTDNCTIGTDIISKTRTFSRGIFRFDLSAIPPGSIIAQAVLTLFNSGGNVGGDSSSFNFTANRVTQPGWTENGVTWNNYASGSAWTTTGGDYSLADRDTFVGGELATAADNIVFANLAALAADALAHRGGLLDLLVIGPEKLAGVGFLKVRTSDYTGDAARRPQLVVDYWRRQVSGSMVGGMHELVGNTCG